MLISQLLRCYSYIVLASMVLTWLPVNDTTRSLTRLVDALTEPLLRPLRKALPPGGSELGNGGALLRAGGSQSPDLTYFPHPPPFR